MAQTIIPIITAKIKNDIIKNIIKQTIAETAIGKYNINVAQNHDIEVYPNNFAIKTPIAIAQYKNGTIERSLITIVSFSINYFLFSGSPQ